MAGSLMTGGITKIWRFIEYSCDMNHVSSWYSISARSFFVYSAIPLQGLHHISISAEIRSQSAVHHISVFGKVQTKLVQRRSRSRKLWTVKWKVRSTPMRFLENGWKIYKRTFSDRSTWSLQQLIQPWVNSESKVYLCSVLHGMALIHWFPIESTARCVTRSLNAMR
jgi:hypothetical protein